jgi:hypothetical protein
MKKIRLGGADTALILRANGKIEMVMPEFKDNDTLPEGIVAFGAVMGNWNKLGYIEMLARDLYESKTQ